MSTAQSSSVIAAQSLGHRPRQPSSLAGFLCTSLSFWTGRSGLGRALQRPPLSHGISSEQQAAVSCFSLLLIDVSLHG